MKDTKLEGLDKDILIDAIEDRIELQVAVIQFIAMFNAMKANHQLRALQVPCVNTWVKMEYMENFILGGSPDYNTGEIETYTVPCDCWRFETQRGIDIADIVPKEFQYHHDDLVQDTGEVHFIHELFNLEVDFNVNHNQVTWFDESGVQQGHVIQL